MQQLKLSERENSLALRMVFKMFACTQSCFATVDDFLDFIGVFFYMFAMSKRGSERRRRCEVCEEISHFQSNTA